MIKIKRVELGAFLIGVLMGGCAHLNNETLLADTSEVIDDGLYVWKKTHPASNGYQWHVVSSEELEKTCQYKNILACARLASNKWQKCHIFSNQSEESTPKWVINHELKHCQGYTHTPEYRYGPKAPKYDFKDFFKKPVDKKDD